MLVIACATKEQHHTATLAETEVGPSSGELRYRYSIRFDASDTGERKPFSAEVNTIKLGFLPVIIIDNSNDRQGFGYAAFVHDGNRWRGPGLPCPAGQADAVKHAARCVSPLAKEEETRF